MKLHVARTAASKGFASKMNPRLQISIYRQGFAVAFFIWVFINFTDFGVQGVWFGIATAVTSGWLLSLIIVRNVARKQIGGLLPTALASPPQNV